MERVQAKVRNILFFFLRSSCFYFILFVFLFIFFILFTDRPSKDTVLPISLEAPSRPGTFIVRLAHC